MKKIDLAQTISILANLGVLAGIVFLAIEVGQNQATLEEQLTLSRVSARDAASDRFNYFSGLLLQNPDLHQTWMKAVAGEELTAFENNQFGRLCNNLLYDRLAIYNRFDALGLPLETEAQVSSLGSLIASSETLTGCWNRIRNAFVNRGYGDFVNLVEQAGGID